MRISILVRIITPLGLLLGSGCSLPPLDLEGFACDSRGSCVAGYTCDGRNVCVSENTSCTMEGNRLRCSGGLQRICSAGTWGPCRDASCIPGELACIDKQAHECAGTGEFKQSEDCGDAGCVAGKCRLCKPDTKFCDGTATVVTCNADGTAELKRTACGDGSCDMACSDGVCEAGTADPGTSCAGSDRNFCTSSCDAEGECVSVPPVCNDEKACTVDSCVPSSGRCLYDPGPQQGNPCGGVDKCLATCSAIGQCDDSAPVDCTSAGVCAECQASSGLCVAGKEDDECRPAVAGGCDIVEVCSGSSVDCPANSFQIDGFVCGPVASGDLCDVNDECDGTTAVCAPLRKDTGDSCGTATCDPADLYNSGMCLASGTCQRSVDDCSLANCEVPVGAEVCSAAEGCLPTAAKDCSATCASCEGRDDPPTCAEADGTCSVGIPSRCGMDSLDRASATSVTVTVGCTDQVVTCTAKGSFYIVRDQVVGTSLNAFDGSSVPPVSGWTTDAAAEPCASLEEKTCPDSKTDYFARVGKVTGTPEVGTATFRTDITGYAEVRHDFFTAASLDEAKDDQPVETATLGYCCGTGCTPVANRWTVPSLKQEWTRSVQGPVGAGDGFVEQNVSNEACLLPHTGTTILTSQFTVRANKVDEFGVDNFSVQGQTAMSVQITTTPGSREHTATALLPAGRTLDDLISIRFRCSWEAKSGAVRSKRIFP